MAMAPPTNISFHLFFAVTFITVVTITTTSTAGPSESHVAAAPSSAEALAFLHARCANTTNATACYNSLLPFAGSFHGSQVKISTAATAVAFGQLKSFLKEVKRIQASGGMGTGSLGDHALGNCVDDLELTLDSETEMFSWLRVLEGSAGWSKDKRDYALHNVQSYLGSGGAAACIEDLTDDAGDAHAGATLSSLVAKKVMAMASNCKQYEQIASDLVEGISITL